MSDLPAGTVTLLFTDIEGSTQLWERSPEAMSAALQRHDVLLRQALGTHGGHVFKTLGDSFYAVFDSVPDALAAALDIQTQVTAETWDVPSGLKLRLALHTGSAERRNDDYFGPSLSRLARLLSAAHGGQILLSQSTATLSRESLPARTDLRDLGSHRLRDLAQPEQIFQLVHPTLPAEFPPLRSLEAFSHNLPLPRTSFLGRERERRQIKERLAATTLLTLTGAGGSGKTRLAVQVAAEIAEHEPERYPDGVWLVELAGQPTGTASVWPAVASVLGLRRQTATLGVNPKDVNLHDRTGRDLRQEMQAALESKRLLLILDNCEHVIDACAQFVETLLSCCGQVGVLATSREALGVAGEAVCPVPPLPVPSVQARTPDHLMQSESARLFVERAAARNPAFALTPANAPAVAALCRRLDGIPLALELAAACVKVLSVEQIAQRLDDRFQLLTGGSRTALPRQQTLRATIDWSYDLLSETERASLARLSVFAGGWSLEAAEVVCAGKPIEDWAVLDALTKLVDKSLVVAGEEKDGTVRYHLPETLRSYSAHRLRERGETAAVHAAHLAFFTALALQAETERRGPAQAGWLSRLEAEHDNLRAALTWALAHDPATGLRLAGALWWFWSGRGHFVEGRRWLNKTLSVDGAPREARAAALTGAGALASRQDDYPAARAALGESLALYRQMGEDAGVARALCLLGIVALNEGRHTEAEHLIGDSLALYRQIGDVWGQAQCVSRLGLAAMLREKHTEARALLEESRVLCQTSGDKSGLAVSLRYLGILLQHDSAAAARQRHEESLVLFRELGDKMQIAGALNSLGLIAAGHYHDYDRARACYLEALEISREIGNRTSQQANLTCLGNLHRLRGEYAEARALYEQSLTVQRELGNKQVIADSLYNLGNLAWHQGDYPAARALQKECLSLFREKDNRRGAGHALYDLAESARCLGEYEEAQRLYAESLSLLEEAGDRRAAARVQGGQGHTSLLQGDLTAARDRMWQSLRLKRDGGDKWGLILGFESLAELAMAEERPEQAAHLWGAADALREALGTPLSPGLRDAHGRARAAARAALGDASFDLAYAKGHGLSLEDAVARALDEI